MYQSFAVRQLTIVIALGLAGSLLATAGGCSSKDPGQKRSSKAVGGLQATKLELANSRKQVDETIAALNTLETAQGDLRPAFDKYKEEVKDLENAAKSARERAADMRARSAEYQKKWAEEMSKVTNPDLKAAAAARADKVRSRYATIQSQAQDVRAAYEPFMRDLKDVQTYLSNDLTPAAITAAKPVFDKAKASGRNLQQKADVLSAEMESVSAEMSPGVPPAKH
jgi:chromosome segregation ATPase